MSDEMLRIKELAEYLKVSERMIYKLMKQGMPKIKVGVNTRFNKKDVLKWLDERTNKVN